MKNYDSYFHKSGIVDLRLSTAMKRHVELVMWYTEGHIIWAAREMGVSYQTMKRWLVRLEKQENITLHFSYKRKKKKSPFNGDELRGKKVFDLGLPKV